MFPPYLPMNIEHMTYLEEHVFMHKSVTHSQKEYMNE